MAAATQRRAIPAKKMIIAPDAASARAVDRFGCLNTSAAGTRMISRAPPCTSKGGLWLLVGIMR